MSEWKAPDAETMALLMAQADPRHAPAALLAAVKAGLPTFEPSDEVIEVWFKAVVHAPPEKPGKRGIKTNHKANTLLRRKNAYRLWVGQGKRNKDASWLSDEKYLQVLAAVLGDRRVTPREKVFEVIRRLEVIGQRWDKLPKERTVRSHVTAYRRKLAKQPKEAN